MRMNLHPLLVVTRSGLVWASALVLGAAYVPVARAFDCTLPKHHCIKVTIDAATSTLNVDNKTLTKKAEPGHVMHWLIDNGSGQAYAFPVRAIVFSSNNGGNTKFRCKPEPGNAHVFQCEDDGIKGTYDYTVTVTGGPLPIHLDPRVVNN